ncbi:hypothetical protein [Actinophytocola sp.]|uniref:hypothetical protein n=1 Tax=Actinophytocola sp. TaxID=1872138 RepID=UPI00389B37A0
MTRRTSTLANVRLDEKSPTACALTSWRDRVHLLWVGTDRRLNLTSSPDGQRFARPHRLPHRTYAYDKSSMDDSFSDMVHTAPALVGTPERLYLAWTGDRGALTLLVADGREFASPTVLEHRSRQAPAVAASGRGAPVLAWLGRDGRVNLLTTVPSRLSQARSAVAPALCGHRDSHVLAWLGNDRRVNLLTLHERGTGAHLRLEEARTFRAPAVCSHQGAVLLAWTGTDQRVNLLTVAENRVSTPIRLEEARTGHAPAVCSHRGRLTLAWIGTDRHLNTANVPMP